MDEPYRRLAAAIVWRGLADLRLRDWADDARRWLSGPDAHSWAVLLDVDRDLADFVQNERVPRRGLKRWTVSQETRQGGLT
ncbi:MAG: hypothetical protein JW934_20860 [Anaerolineae bacterium]|nr:hypothetical protein [Anaerolineae bacterium]